jgi:hypothetical protein
MASRIAIANALKALSALQLTWSSWTITDGDHSPREGNAHARLFPHSAQKIVEHEESFRMTMFRSFLVSVPSQRLHMADLRDLPQPVKAPK